MALGEPKVVAADTRDLFAEAEALAAKMGVDPGPGHLIWVIADGGTRMAALLHGAGYDLAAEHLALEGRVSTDVTLDDVRSAAKSRETFGSTLLVSAQLAAAFAAGGEYVDGLRRRLAIRGDLRVVIS